MLVFHFNDDDLGTEHERTENFQLDGVGLAGAGSGEHDVIRVLHREAIEQDERVVVAVDAEQHAVVRGQVSAGERERRGDRAGVHVEADHQLVVTDRDS